MKVVYYRLFVKDISKIKQQRLKKQVENTILSIKKEANLDQIPNLIKMKNHDTAYRMRIGKYRMGFFYEDGVINIARFVKREDIYDVFP